MPQLTALTVTGLLGRFNHELEFPSEWEFVILHGPNGVGKTKLLEMIAAVGRGRPTSLLAIPFAAARFSFDDGTLLVIARTSQQTLLEDESPSNTDHLLLSLTRAGEETRQATLASAEHSERILSRFERDLPLDRVEHNLWHDYNMGDYIDIGGISERYPGYAGLPSTTQQLPEEFTALFADFPVHLIETQRLITLQRPSRSGHRAAIDQRNTVVNFAQDLTRLLSDALASNSRTSQQLDRTFPRRILEAQAAPDVSDQDIREMYRAQSDLRDRLAEIALLDAPEDDLRLPDRELQSWELRMLWTYLNDTAEKLDTFRDLLDRVELLRDIINSRFLFKTMRIDRDKGFRFETDVAHEIGPVDLSSGEQHELVLAYDLLFNVKAGTTVLIDEPEISLHIKWQQHFLADLMRIAQLRSLRFVVATHSPQIIHKRWDRAIALYGDSSDADFHDDNA